MLRPHVICNIQRPEPALLALFREQSVATAHEAMGRQGAMDSRIRPAYSGSTLCGPAITVRCHQGDNLMLIKAIYVARPGDVLVADMEDSGEVDG
jgi:4-hydroxy-4-methyl-2-oxoglutarate aldolase